MHDHSQYKMDLSPVYIDCAFDITQLRGGQAESVRGGQAESVRGGQAESVRAGQAE